MSHCWISTAELEGVSAEGKSSEAKVTVADLLCRTLHSFWPCFHSCPPFPHTVDAQHYSLFLFLLGCHSRSSSHALTQSHSLVPRISTLSSHQSLSTFSHHPLHHGQSDSPPHPCCAAPFSPPRLRYLIRAASSSSLSHPRCLTLAVSSSLPHPRCNVLAPTE